MARFSVVITDDSYGVNNVEAEVLKEIDARVTIINCITEEDMITHCKSADAILVNRTLVTRRVIESLEKCKIICRYGTGYDNVNVQAATEHGIWVANVRGYCAIEVAEHALALLFSAARTVTYNDRSIRSGQWDLTSDAARMSGSVLGIIGFGSTGQALYNMVRGFDFSRILIFDRSGEKKVSLLNKTGEFASLDYLLETADFISLHVPLTEQTRHIIDSRAVSLMKKTAVLVNTARGALIDENAVAHALRSGRLSAGGFDVFAEEPIRPDNPLRLCGNAVLTNHIAYYSPQSRESLQRLVAQNAKAVLSGSKPLFPLNSL